MTLAAQVTPTGIIAPSYADILEELTLQYQAIYGSDVVVTADSQDGQFLAIFAQALYDSNQLAVAVYNAFSPATAQGAGLSSVVKINGLMRKTPSNSTAVETITGPSGTTINNGIVADANGYQWALPAAVTIPLSGSIDVTVTCTTIGNIAAAPGTITKIATPTAGWQSATNNAAATPGAPVEADATLRQRQSVSTALPAQSVVGGIYGAIANLTGVQRLQIYENDLGSPDSNGLPGHSISVVVEGGSVTDVANTIALKKTPGTDTYGSTTEIVVDPQGVPNTINFFVLSLQRIVVAVSITPLLGYVSTTAAVIQGAIAAFLNDLEIGEISYLARLYSPANLSGDAATTSSGFTQAQLDALSATYVVTAITQAVYPNAPSAANIAIAFNQAASCQTSDIAITA